MNYVFHPAAEAEFLEAVGYYESRIPGLGKTLVDEFDQLMSLLSDNPGAWQIQLPPDIRRVPLRRFPLSVIYRTQSDSVQILAIAHERRRPNYWVKRTDSE